MNGPVFNYDLLIIGCGSGGVQAAVQGAKLGKKVGIIEKNPNHIGGAWIQTGTIPSKTLRETLATVHSIKAHCGKEWVSRLIDDLGTGSAFGRAEAVAAQEESVVRGFLRKNDVEIIVGTASIESEHAVRIINPEGETKVLTAANIVIATGSKPRRPEDIPFDGWRVVDSDEILHISSIPKEMLIYGAGVIGCEYACIFAAMGVDVTIVDSRDTIMQTLDIEIAKEMRKIMEEQGIHFLMGRKLVSVMSDGPNATVKLSDSTELSTALIFYAGGRIATTEHLGLERLGIPLTDRGCIAVNQHFQTSVSTIYAVGDAIGSPSLAATSAEQGRYAASHAISGPTREFPRVFPVGIYTIPEVSCVGYTEEELVTMGKKFIVGRAHYRELARGYIRGESNGLLKMLVCSETSKILGLHIVGADACNLIHIGLGFMLYDAKVNDIIDKMIFNYPTLAEAYRIASFNAINKIIAAKEGRTKKKQLDVA